MRADSVLIQEIVICFLGSNFFQIVFTQSIQAKPCILVWDTISYKSCFPFISVGGTLNNNVLLPFMQQEVSVLLQQYVNQYDAYATH